VKLLLDTHLLLWWLVGEAGMLGATQDLISDPQNAIFVSAVSLWEIWLKESLGKLRLPSDFDTRVAAEEFEHLPLLAEHTREVARLPWHHRDPFDRMLIAQARVTGLRLLTSDEPLKMYGDAVFVIR
jgi:PIN domain nuclease of toxin-antitoxin system